MADDWEATRWWRVIDPDGKLWCETSDEDEARGHLETCPRGRLQHLHRRVEYDWRDETVTRERGAE